MFFNILKTIGVVGVFVAGAVLGDLNSSLRWEKNLLGHGYGEYNKKTGKWQLCEPEVVLLNRNTEAIKILNGGTVTISDYVKVIESDLSEAKAKVESQLKELAEQDVLIEKYKKNIKLPAETTKNVKRPVERFDPSVIITK
jgi:hypothetical protein